jgi:branched-chain amino acid transport system permease protein
LELLFANLLNGVSYASILFIIASGLSLVFGVRYHNLGTGRYTCWGFPGIAAAESTHNFFLGVVAAGAFSSSV